MSLTSLVLRGVLGAVEPYLECVVLTVNEMKYIQWVEFELSKWSSCIQCSQCSLWCSSVVNSFFSLFFSSFQFLSLSCVRSFNQRHFMSSGGLGLFQRTVDAAKKKYGRTEPRHIHEPGFSTNIIFFLFFGHALRGLPIQTEPPFTNMHTSPKISLVQKNICNVFEHSQSHNDPCLRMPRFDSTFFLLWWPWFVCCLGVFGVLVCVGERSSKLSCIEEAPGIF